MVRQLPGADRLHDAVSKGEVVVVCGPSGPVKARSSRPSTGSSRFKKAISSSMASRSRAKDTNLSEIALAHRHGVPEFRVVSPPVDHRKPDARPDQGARPPQGRGHRARAQTARPRRVERARKTNFRDSSPAASSSASRLRARCRWTRSRCCSTSRPPRSIPR